MAPLPPARQGKPGLTARLLRIARGPAADSSDCAHNYIVHHVDGKPVYVCSKCGHTIR